MWFKNNSFKLIKEIEQERSKLERDKIRLEEERNELFAKEKLISAERSDIAALRETIWSSAFNLGFSKAWDMVYPLMTDGMNKIISKVKTDAIEETLNGLEGHINKKIAQTGDLRLKEKSDVLIKIQELEKRIQTSTNPESKKTLDNFKEALRWLTNDDIQKD